MKMTHVWVRLFEDAIEIARGVWQVAADVGLHGKAFRAHLFAKRAKSRHRVDAHLMALLTLLTAQLRHERLGSSNLHAVNHVRNFHTGCLNLRPRKISSSSIPGQDGDKLLTHLSQCIRFTVRSRMYIRIISDIANMPV